MQATRPRRKATRRAAQSDLWASLLLLPILVPTLLSALVPDVETLPWGLLLIPLFARHARRSMLVLFSAHLVVLLTIILFTGEQHFVVPLLKLENWAVGFFFASEFLVRRMADSARLIFWPLLAIGAIQWLPSLYAFISPLIELLFSRVFANAYGSYRGVSLLYTEPARAGYYVFCLYFLIRSGLTRPIRFLPAITLGVLFVLCTSTTSVFFACCVLLLEAGPVTRTIWRYERTFIVVAVPVFGLLLVVLFFSFVMNNPKVAFILSGRGLSGIFYNLSLASGGRATAFATMAQEVIAWPIGHLFQGEAHNSQVWFSSMLFRGYRMRYSSIPVSGMMVQMYIIGVVPVLLMLWLAWTRQKAFQCAVVATAFLFYSPPGDSMLFILLAVIRYAPPPLAHRRKAEKSPGYLTVSRST